MGLDNLVDSQHFVDDHWRSSPVKSPSCPHWCRCRSTPSWRPQGLPCSAWKDDYGGKRWLFWREHSAFVVLPTNCNFCAPYREWRIRQWERCCLMPTTPRSGPMDSTRSPSSSSPGHQGYLTSSCLCRPSWTNCLLFIIHLNLLPPPPPIILWLKLNALKLIPLALLEMILDWQWNMKHAHHVVSQSRHMFSSKSRLFPSQDQCRSDQRVFQVIISRSYHI